MKKKFPLWSFFCWCILGTMLTNCSSTISFAEIPVSNVAKGSHTYSKEMNLKKIRDVVENQKMSPQEKVKFLAHHCTIRDLNKLFWYLNFVGIELKEEVLTLHPGKEIFAGKVNPSIEASLECMEGAMLATTILHEKNIKAYVLLIHGLNLKPGHAICVYRTKKGWGTIGVNLTDFIEPTQPLEKFKEILNTRFKYYLKPNNGNISLFAICEPKNIHPNFMNGKPKKILWSNIVNFFKSSWY